MFELTRSQRTVSWENRRRGVQGPGRPNSTRIHGECRRLVHWSGPIHAPTRTLDERSIILPSSANLHTTADHCHPSLMNLNSCHRTSDRLSGPSVSFLGKAYNSSSTRNLPRSISLGSIDELRSHTFVSTQRRVLSNPSIPSRQSSLLDRANTLTQRAWPRPATLWDVGDGQVSRQLRQDRLFVDLQDGYEVNFLLSSSSDVAQASSAAHRRLGSGVNSYRCPRRNDLTPLLVRSTSIQRGVEGPHHQGKVPLFVPSRIIEPAASAPRLTNQVVSCPSPGPTSSVIGVVDGQHENNPGNQSREALTDASDWSTTVQTGGQELGGRISGSKSPSDQDVNPVDRRDLATRRTLHGLLSSVTIKSQSIWGSEQSTQLAPGDEELVDGKQKSQTPWLKRNCGFYIRHMKKELWWGREKKNAHEKA